MNIGKIDKAMAEKPSDENGIRWYYPYEKPFLLKGFEWFDRDHAYERFPIKKTESVTQYPNGIKTSIPAKDCGAYTLAQMTAGGRVYFRTNSTRVVLDYTLLNQGGMDHMAFTGTAGFDLYCRYENEPWKFVSVTRVNQLETQFHAVPAGCDVPKIMHDCILHFPLYNGVKSVSIGLDEDAVVEKFEELDNQKKIVLYGTSITHGGCATRPGMAGSNIMSRLLGMDVVNFGFSGNGKGEPEIASLIAEVKDPAIYLLDFDWNIGSPAEMAAALPGFIDILRKDHPTIPIIVISRTPGTCTAFKELQPQRREIVNCTGIKEVQIAEVKRRIAAGDKHISFLDGDTTLGEDWWECLVDGIHMTDLGFLRWAKNISAEVKKVLAK